MAGWPSRFAGQVFKQRTFVRGHEFARFGEGKMRRSRGFADRGLRGCPSAHKRAGRPGRALTMQDAAA